MHRRGDSSGAQAQDSVSTSSGFSHSSRIRITAPRRDWRGEPLGKPTISRALSDRNPNSDFSDTESLSSWSTTGSGDGFSVAKTLRSTKYDSRISEIRSHKREDFLPENQASKFESDWRSDSGVPDRIKPRATKSVLYGTVDQSKYRDHRTKCDPVQLYHNYKAYWKNNQIPGENPHRQLRWNIRSMLMRKDYELAEPAQNRRPRSPETDFDPDQLLFLPPRRYLDELSHSNAGSRDGQTETDSIRNWSPPPPTPSRRPVAPRKLHRLVFRSP